VRICTTNPGKVAEFGGLLAPLDIRLTPTTKEDIPETGGTFHDNAREKAQGYAKLYPDCWILSEDSGLVIPALDDLPGPFSARFDDLDLTSSMIKGGRVTPSGRPRDQMDPANNERVLHLMKDVHQAARGAYFVAYIVVIDPEGDIAFEVEQRAYGWITTELRGTGGFGYDPLFESDTSFGQTWAEIDTARKDLISHRSRAVWDLMAWLCSTKREVV